MSQDQLKSYLIGITWDRVPRLNRVLKLNPFFNTLLEDDDLDDEFDDDDIPVKPRIRAPRREPKCDTFSIGEQTVKHYFKNFVDTFGEQAGVNLLWMFEETSIDEFETCSYFDLITIMLEYSLKRNGCTEEWDRPIEDIDNRPPPANWPRRI